jgi:ribose-phosphate pyrophosphokinase
MAASEQAPSAEGARVAQDKRLMLFSGRANPDLAAAIAKDLGVPLGGVTLKTFSAGEVYCRYDESIRDCDVFIVQPTCNNPVTGMTANDALVELLLMIDAAVGASARRVIAVVPWFGYSRQDKRSALREPISARVVAHVLEAAGADRVITVDLHAAQVQGFFTKPVDDITALLVLAKYFTDLELDDLVIVSPDVGRVKLNHKFAEKVGADLALMTKDRPAHQVAEIGYVIGDVRGKTAVIVDDIIDSAGTLSAAAQTVLDEGAARVFAAATHGLFSGKAWENLAAVPFEKIVVTDTVPLQPGAPDNVVVLSLAGVLADSIRQVATGGSVNRGFSGENMLF